MSRQKVMEGWECRICCEQIDNQPHVRIAVDVAVEEDIGGVSSLMNDEVMILGVFHTACISETLGDEELEEDVLYLREARELSRLLGDKRSKKQDPPPRAKRQSHLQVINGGFR